MTTRDTPPSGLKITDELHERLYDLGIQFGIDGIISNAWQAGHLTPIFRSEEHAIRFGRRTLDVSIHQSLGAAERLQQGAIRSEWVDVEKHAGVAMKALKALARALSGESVLSSAEPLVPPLRQIANGLRDGPPSFAAYEDTKAQAGQDAAALFRSISVVKEVHEFSSARVLQMAGRTNPGDPQKAAFILAMAEGWMCLTGTLPSSSTSMTTNPFMRFAATGWSDAGWPFDGDEHTVDTVHSFGQSAITTAIKTLSEVQVPTGSDYRPVWI